jgi:hypothetical protein
MERGRTQRNNAGNSVARNSVAVALFWLSAFCMLLTSSSFLLMPMASRKAMNGEGWWLILSCALFWAPLIAGYILLFLANRIRKRQDAGKRNRRSGVRYWGVFRVASNVPAAIVDAAAVLSLIGLILFIILKPEHYGIYMLLCLTIFAFHMHGMFNGVNYRAIVRVRSYSKRQEGNTNGTD